MMRAMLSSVLVLAVVAVGLATWADDAKKTDAKKGVKATITKVDPKAKTITVKMKDKDGKDVEKTFNLTEDVVYMDSTGKVATLDVFQNGDQILVVEAEGKIKQLQKDAKKPATKDNK